MFEIFIFSFILWVLIGGISYQWCRKDEIIYNSGDFNSKEFRKWNLPLHLVCGPIAFIFTTLVWITLRFRRNSGDK